MDIAKNATLKKLLSALSTYSKQSKKTWFKYNRDQG